METIRSSDSKETNPKKYYSIDLRNTYLTKSPNLVASGYLRNNPTWASKQHIHDYTELIFCTAGNGTTEIYNTQYEINPGDLIVHNPNTPHNEVSNPDNPLEFLFIGIKDFQVKGLPENDIMLKNSLPVRRTGEYMEQFQLFFSELLKETFEERDHFDIISEAIGTCILTMALRVINSDTIVTGKAMSHSFRIKEYIDNNFTSDLDLTHLSSAVYISSTYLSHQFKSEIGMSPIQYMIKKRIEYAKELLVTTDKSIARIANQCGYDDPGYFSQAFKRITGDSPKEFRKRSKNT